MFTKQCSSNTQQTKKNVRITSELMKAFAIQSSVVCVTNKFVTSKQTQPFRSGLLENERLSSNEACFLQFEDRKVLFVMCIRSVPNIRIESFG